MCKKMFIAIKNINLYLKNINHAFEKVFNTYILKNVNHVFKKHLTCIENIQLYPETVYYVYESKVALKTYI